MTNHHRHPPEAFHTQLLEFSRLTIGNHLPESPHILGTLITPSIAAEPAEMFPITSQFVATLNPLSSGMIDGAINLQWSRPIQAAAWAAIRD